MRAHSTLIDVYSKLLQHWLDTGALTANQLAQHRARQHQFGLATFDRNLLGDCSHLPSAPCDQCLLEGDVATPSGVYSKLDHIWLEFGYKLWAGNSWLLEICLKKT